MFDSKILLNYARDGFLTAIDVITEQQANAHRQEMERAERVLGSLHYKTKVHTMLRSPAALATMPSVLDLVEAIIGPNILLYNVTYIIKEPGTRAHVSWHQDLTYWGLSHDDQVSMWLALSPATETSGCMRMVPGSHSAGKIQHHATEDNDNVLLQGQTVNDVSERQAVMCPLKPGQASFHHGWTLHASMPNQSDDRRIGLNIQYLATHVQQTKRDLDTALLVRGRDSFQHFEQDTLAISDLEPDAIAQQRKLEQRYNSIAGSGGVQK